MANWNCNYIYDVPPSQDYQEYGVYDESLDTATVPLEYVGPIYSVLYTGVTSYELNGTTYYNYNLYEIPVFSSSEYDSISSGLRSNYVLSNTSYSHSSSASILYNSSSDISYTVENHGLFTETFNSYNSFPSLDENDSTNTENISCPSTQVENHTDIKDEDSNSEIVIESHINRSAFTTRAVVNNCIEYNVLEQHNTVSETDIDEDYEEYLLIYEDSKILSCSVQIEDDDLKESDKVSYEKSKISDWSVEIEEDEVKESEKDIYEESEESDWSVEIDYDDMKESEEVIYKESKISDWSVETEDDDMKESDEVIYKESKISDYSVETEAGDMKESEKAIYKESKISDWSVETEDDDLKESEKVMFEESEESDWSVEIEDDDMKESEEVIYEEIKISDWSVEVEDDVTESEKVLYEECVHQSLSNEETVVLDWSVEVPDNDVKTYDDDNFNKVNSLRSSDIDPIYSTVDIKILKEKLYLEALSGHLSLKESVPIVDVLPVIKEESESVEDSGIETYGKESDLLVENISKLVKTDHVFNADSQKHQSGKENLLEIQNDDIKKIEKIAATKIEPWCCNDEALLKSDEEVAKCNEVISNETARNYIMNDTGHASLDTGSNGEYYSKANREKIMENEENASRKKSKKNFKGLRKWLSSVFSCARKKT